MIHVEFDGMKMRMSYAKHILRLLEIMHINLLYYIIAMYHFKIMKGIQMI